MFPLYVDLSGQLCVVIGGGPVGRRKAEKLSNHGAVVRIVSLHEAPPDWTCPHIDWKVEAYQRHHLFDARLVVAAANPEVNHQVVEDAKAFGVWVNAAEDPSQGDCLFPSTAKHGGINIAVSTGGRAPGVARQVATLLREHVDDAMADWLALVAEVRDWLLAKNVAEDRRREILRDLSQPSWLERIRDKGVAVVRNEVWQIVFAEFANKM